VKGLIITLAALAFLAGVASANQEMVVPRDVRSMPRVDWFWFDDLEPADPGWTHGSGVFDPCSQPKERFDIYPLYPNWGVGNTVVRAQSFTPQEAYSLCGVSLMMSQSGAATLYIQDGPTANPTNIYASGTATVPGAEGWVFFDTEPDIWTAPEEMLYLRLDQGPPFWRKYEDLSEPPWDAYPRGEAFEDGMWYGDDFHDFWFITYTYWDVPPDAPGGGTRSGDYWHIIENLCKSWSPTHVWVNTSPDTNDAFVPPNTENWLVTPFLDLSDAVTCTTFFIMQYFTPTVDDDHWIEEVTTDGGLTWTQLGAWWGDQCDLGYGPCDHFLSSHDITALLPGTGVGAYKWTYYTTSNGAGPDVCGCAGITIDDGGFYGEREGSPVEKATWGSVKALYR